MGDDDLPAELGPLLEGLTGRARDARVALLRDLLAAGHPPTALLEAGTADRLALLPVLDVLTDAGGRTLADIAAQHDMPVEDLVATRRALGLPVDTEGAVYGPTAEALARLLGSTLAAGIPLDALVTFNHVIGPATAAIAAGARDAVRELLGNVDPDGDEYTRARHAAAATTVLQPVLTEVVSATLAEHLREVGRHAMASVLVSTDHDDVVDVTVAFADLVGFTALGETVEPRQLGAVAVRLADLARESLVDGCELVKTLGDAVMLAAASSAAVLRSAAALTAAVAADQELPDLRTGIAAGPALPRAGDFYGAVVNRASRLTAVAEPHSMVVDDAVHSAVAADGHTWTDLGSVPIRGLREPVRCWATR